MKRSFIHTLSGLVATSTLLATGSVFFSACAEGGEVGRSSTSNGGGNAGGGGESDAGGAAGAGGNGGSAGNAGGEGGGATVVDLALCVLNDAGPADPCETPVELSFDTIAAGTQSMRMFRVDNKSTADAVFDAVTIQDPDYSVQVVRYVEDPPSDPTQWIRVPVSLPSTRPPNGALYFEVTYTSDGSAKMLAPMDVVVSATVGGQKAPDIVVPIVGEALGCASGTAACDNDPNNGCETDTNTTAEHCGACDNACNLSGASSACENGSCKVVACSSGFGNCNGIDNDGCEVDTKTNIANCGGCNIQCDLPNASEVCAESKCLLNECAAPFDNCDILVANGCETDLQTSLAHCGACNTPCSLVNATEACVNGACSITSCDAPFNDCDKLASNGCEIDVSTDVLNCGTCGTMCNTPNAMPACANGMCAVGMCNSGFANCDNIVTNGCEKNVANDTLNCGSCNNSCAATMANANVGCSNGSCQLLSCQAGYFNTDGNPLNGCECAFVGADSPDDSFLDTNCDGIDGDASVAIFVAKAGNDANPGTRQQPVATIATALSRAVIQGKTQIYVSEGIYDGTVTLFNGISIYGGYSAANNWARSASYTVTFRSSTVTNDRVSAVEGKNLTSPMTLDRLTILTLNTNATGVSNYAMYCNNCGGVTLRKSTLTAGAAGAGSTGTNGTAGAAGGNGGNGSPGACDLSGVRTGGAAGTSTCSRTGGNGGNGGAPGVNSGGNGGTGTGGTSGGTGGSGGDPGQGGGSGGAGLAGTNGTNGAGGNGGSTATNFFVANAGGNGITGVHGNGGGGGGGGGGQGGGIVITGGGNGGGGGGGGGCAGTGGTGGGGGGGSFGLFLVSSNGMQLLDNTITSSKGGNGGAGGNGAAGGNGGAAGNGATTCTNEVGAGGNGGAGGKGGNGGHGGGGAGGPSFAIYRVNSGFVTGAGNTLNFGAGGTGGASLGNAGTAGATGTVF